MVCDAVLFCAVPERPNITNVYAWLDEQQNEPQPVIYVEWTVSYNSSPLFYVNIHGCILVAVSEAIIVEYIISLVRSGSADRRPRVIIGCITSRMIDD